MSDLWALYAACAFAFGALGLYLVHLWLDARRLSRDEKRLGLAGERGERSGDGRKVDDN